MKWTPLQLACLTRDNTFLDDFCTFEIQSPNRKHCLIIRVAVQSAEKWFNALMASVEATINDAMEKANSALTGTVVIRPEFKFPAKIEMAFFQILAIRR